MWGWVYSCLSTHTSLFSAPCMSLIPTDHKDDPSEQWRYWCSALKSTLCAQPDAAVLGWGQGMVWVQIWIVVLLLKAGPKFFVPESVYVVCGELNPPPLVIGVSCLGLVTYTIFSTQLGNAENTHWLWGLRDSPQTWPKSCVNEISRS